MAKSSKWTLNTVYIPKTLQMWVNILMTFIFQKGEAQDSTVSWVLRGLVNPEPCPAVNPDWWDCKPLR